MPTSKRIHKNGSVAYQASDHTPHFPSLSKTFATRKAAREWLPAVHGERRRSLNYDHKQNACMSLGEAMQKYTAFKTPRKKGARQEMSLAKRWQKHPFALRPIGEILPFEFDGYVTARIETGAAASTILKELSLVSQEGGRVDRHSTQRLRRARRYSCRGGEPKHRYQLAINTSAQDSARS